MFFLQIAFIKLFYRARKNETALLTSGYVFCYVCVYKHVKEKRNCPVTGYKTDLSNLVKIYPPAWCRPIPATNPVKSLMIAARYTWMIWSRDLVRKLFKIWINSIALPCHVESYNISLLYVWLYHNLIVCNNLVA